MRYFQQCGGIDCKPVCGEITYGIERIAMFIQEVDSVYDIEWVDGISYGDVYHQNEVDYSTYNFQVSNEQMLFKLFEMYEKETADVIAAGLVQPAYDYALKCSHTFNLLDARGAISVTERQSYIARVRELAKMCANAYVEQRKKLGYPMLKDEKIRKELGLDAEGGDQ